VTDWRAVIRDLRRMGWRYIDIAAELDQGEYWVSRVARGYTLHVDYDVGKRLIELHARETTKVQVTIDGIR